MDTENKAWVDVISGVEEADLVSVEVIDKLIADHRKAIESHKEEVKLSQDSIKRLELKKKALRFGANTIIFELADELWEKERDLFDVIPFNWIDFIPVEGSNKSQQKYYHRAKKILETARELNINVSKAIKLVTL